MDRALDSLTDVFGDRLKFDSALGALTTYRVGGNATAIVNVETVAELKRLTAIDVPILIVGKGSNMLVSDEGFDGLAVQLAGEFLEIVFNGSLVKVGGAVALPVLARKSVAESLTGLEWYVGVPGSVGGAVRMNAGGHGSQTSDVLVSAELISIGEGRTGSFQATDLDLGYRRSNVRPNEVVSSATYQLSQGNQAQGEATISEIVSWRREHQPGGQNAGSVFANPEGHSSAELIEKCGLKGHRIGTAQVSEKHSNFIQADPDGKANDVYELIQYVRGEVAAKTGITLRTEVRLVGFDSQYDSSKS